MPSSPGKNLIALLACVPLAASAQAQITELPGYGTGTHSFGFAAAYAPVSGQIWGYTTNTRFGSVMLHYSVPLTHGTRTRLRYAPEIVPFATLLERAPSETNDAAPVRSYAAGARPVGLQLDFRRGSRIQPFGSGTAGFLYYDRRVLSSGGSQWMFTVDFGGGVHLFASRQNAVNIGYRYQHESNANISLHNPGTDSHTLTVGILHFTRR